MISLKQYILESSIRKKFHVLLGQIKFDKIPTVDKLATMIKDGLDEAVRRWQIVRIKAVEEYNKSVDNRNEARLKKELAEKEAEVIQHIQSHPGLLRRSKEKQQEYIDKKLEVIKSKFRPEEYAAVNFDTSKIYCVWYNDPVSEVHDKGFDTYDDKKYTIDKIASDIAADIYETMESDAKFSSKKEYHVWEHLVGIDFVCYERDLRYWRPCFGLVPMFDEETEKWLPETVEKHLIHMNSMSLD